MSGYIYQRGAAPLMQWRRGIPPIGIRAADNVALGDLTIIPGGPEAIAGMADIVPSPQSFLIGAAVGGMAAYFLVGRFMTRPPR